MKIKIVRHVVSLCWAAIVVLLLTGCNPTRKREAVWIDKDTCGKCDDLLSFEPVGNGHWEYLKKKEYDGDVNRLEKGYLRALERLNNLSEKKSFETYNGATFTFDAWAAFLDLEIVIDLKTAEQVVSEKLFPIGTVEPDGITCAAESGNIYTLFDDSIFLSGDCIENFLNMLFIHGRKPKKLM